MANTGEQKGVRTESTSHRPYERCRAERSAATSQSRAFAQMCAKRCDSVAGRNACSMATLLSADVGGGKEQVYVCLGVGFARFA